MTENQTKKLTEMRRMAEARENSARLNIRYARLCLANGDKRGAERGFKFAIHNARAAEIWTANAERYVAACA